MLDAWNIAKYEDKIEDPSQDEEFGSYVDLWGPLQDGQYSLVQATGDNSKKWFLPSKSELAAFGGEIGITDYEEFGMGENHYWSSSYLDTHFGADVYLAFFLSGGYVNMGCWCGCEQSGGIRLSSTF